jgi:peptidoglycan/LPS O-acetylase OafA/YrhL
MAETAPPARLRELDALRGIAATIVVLYHLTWRGVEVLPAAQTISHGISWGHFGVELFFAISGFVIFMTLERTRSAADFAVNRFARLFPAYWAAIMVTSAAMVLLNAPKLALTGNMILFNLTMLQSYFYFPLVDGVYWTLSAELGFYVCMLALWRLGLLGRIELVLLAWIGLKLVWWLVPAMPTRPGMLLVQLYIPWFAIGICAYRVKSGARSWTLQLPVLLAGLAVTALVPDPGDSKADALVAAGVYVGVALLFAALLAGWLRGLDHPWLVWLGALSFPLYLVHQNIGYALIAATERGGASPLLALGLALITVFALALTVHLLVEKPALGAIRKGWKAHRAKAPAAANALV